MLGLVLAVGSCVAGFAAELPQVHIALTVYQGDPLGSKEAGTIRVVSKPLLATRSGRPAIITSGQRVPVTKPDGTTADEQAGVQVEFLPLITGTGTSGSR